jgi:glycosyltransferase involved in cell wall biosynthesis
MSLSRTPRTGKKIRFLYCGQLVHRKGVDILIDAFCRVAPRHPQAELILLGSGMLRDSLEKQVPESLRNRIRFEGHVEWENLPKLYSTADVFTFASRYDGWGMVVPEAMAAGLPIITTSAVGSAVDLIQNQKNGFLFESENTEQLANHMEFFCQHPQECARMGAQARETARSVDAKQASNRLIDILTEEMR